MSMSTHVVAFRPADEKWNIMKSAYDACEKAGIPTPKEVNEFFNYEIPNENGVEVDIEQAMKEWSNDSCSGYDIDIRKLPKDVNIIRFYNSW